MLINNIDVKTFYGKQLTADIQPINFVNKDIWVAAAIMPTFIESDLTFKNINIVMLFHGDSRDSILLNISKVLSHLKNESDIVLDGHNHIYKVKLDSSNIVKSMNKHAYRLELKFKGYEYSSEVTIQANKTNSYTVNNVGTCITPARIEITSEINQIDFTIEGLGKYPIKVTGLNAGKTLIIDAEDGTIIEDGSSRFKDVEIWEYPKLLAGDNTIKFSRNNVNVTFKFKPHYI